MYYMITVKRKYKQRGTVPCEGYWLYDIEILETIPGFVRGTILSNMTRREYKDWIEKYIISEDF